MKNFYNDKEFPALSPRACQLIREIGRNPDKESGERFTAGNRGDYRPWNRSMEAGHYHEETRQAAAELVAAGHANTSETGFVFSITLTEKGAELSRFLSS